VPRCLGAHASRGRAKGDARTLAPPFAPQPGGAAAQWNEPRINCANKQVLWLVEDEVQDDQYDQRDAKQPAEKVRHDVISFRIEV
jgi:hypothetical protein